MSTYLLTYIRCLFIVYYLYQQMQIYIYIYIYKIILQTLLYVYMLITNLMH